MQLFIYFSVVIFTISSAQQLKNGRYVAPEFNVYLTPDEVQALQAMRSSQNSASFETSKPNSEIGEESYNELIQKFYAENLKPAPIEESQEEQRPSLSNFFFPKDVSIYSDRPNFNLNSYKQLLMDQTKLSRYSLRNKLNEPSFFKPASDSNKNKDQRKSAVEKEREYILRNGRIYEPRKFNSPIKVRFQNSDINVGQQKSAVEKEIENAWRQYEAYESERLNSPAEIIKQILSARYKNQKKIEVRKPISHSLRNDQAYWFERSNAPTETNNQGSQYRNEGQNESEVERELKHFWGKQPNSQLQKPFFSAGFSNQHPSGINKNKEKSEEDKKIENIFKQQDFGFERLYSPDASSQTLSGKNENLENLDIGKLLELILRNRNDDFSREKAPEIKNQVNLVINRKINRSDLDKEIQDILKKHQDFEFQKSKSAAEVISQSSPLQIHKHVSITKHIPVPVLKTVQLAVPTPVLVPIPQPYEVKVPFIPSSLHLYLPPLKVLKKNPVSLMSHY